VIVMRKRLVILCGFGSMLIGATIFSAADAHHRKLQAVAQVEQLARLRAEIERLYSESRGVDDAPWDTRRGRQE